MEIINTNFEESFDIVKEAIEKASFISFDTEFTGLEYLKSKEIHQFDNPQERYLKLLKAAKKYIIIQFGICAFNYSEKDNCFYYSAFNFYIFPRKFKDGSEVAFLCQSSSLDYLSKHNFDFGKVIKHGISYILPKDERRILELYSDHDYFATANKPINSIPIDVKDIYKPFFDRMMLKTEEFVNKRINGSIDLDTCDSYARKILYEHILSKYNNNVFLETKTSDKDERFIRVSFSNDISQLKHSIENRKRREALLELNKAVGFTKVVKLIQDSKKLIIGHNMMLDLMHTIHQFCEPLTTDFNEFKSLIRVLFPRIMDTKLIATAPELKNLVNNNNLEELYISLKAIKDDKAVDIVAGLNMYEYEDKKCFHDAGYDAYVTGVCFILMAKYLSGNHDLGNTFDKFHHLSAFENKIFLMKSIDIQHIDLDGPDVLPTRDHVFYIQFVKDKKHEVKDLFSAFGNIQFKFLSDEDALISYNIKTHAIYAKSLILKRDSWYKVISYNDYAKQNSLEIGKISSRKRKCNQMDKEGDEMLDNLGGCIKISEKSAKKLHTQSLTIENNKGHKDGDIFEVPDWTS